MFLTSYPFSFFFLFPLSFIFIPYFSPGCHGPGFDTVEHGMAIWVAHVLSLALAVLIMGVGLEKGWRGGVLGGWFPQQVSGLVQMP